MIYQSDKKEKQRIVGGESFAMKVLLVLITLCSVRGRFIKFAAGIEIFYEDLKKMNASCYPKDSCTEARLGDSPGILENYACSCDRLCSNLDTCCIDSPHRNILSSALKPRCRTVENSSSPRGFYMVDRCLMDGNFNPIWEYLCEEEWNGEDNIMKIAPVTSLFSSVTYKNYFCFRCHERTHEFLFWNVQLLSDYNGSVVLRENGDFSVTYDQDNKTWMATYGEEGASFPVNLRFEIPNTIKPFAMRCEPDAISNCSGTWPDANIGEICDTYTAIVYIRRDGEVLKYKNAHCAVCNYESLANMACQQTVAVAFSEKRLFSFSHVLDINIFNGERVGKTKKCDENFVWDPYSQICKEITCAIPGYTIKNGQCSPP